jgi:hypothetical protein
MPKAPAFLRLGSGEPVGIGDLSNWPEGTAVLRIYTPVVLWVAHLVFSVTSNGDQSRPAEVALSPGLSFRTDDVCHVATIAAKIPHGT